MQARNSSAEQSRTLTEQARRAQIVSAAIGTIADLGYRNATFAQIARRAGLSSTGLISYHFAGKEELISEVVRTVLADIGAFMPHPDAGEPLVMPLQAEEQALKRALYDCHHSQRAILAEFPTDRESFRVAPRYHFAAPPHAGQIGYRRFSWTMPGSAWRARAWEAMRALGLEQELA